MILNNTQQWGGARLEQKAFEKIAAVQLNASATRAYLAFPWSELITALESNEPLQQELLASLDLLQHQAKDFLQIASVCQHPRALRYASLFERVGVTHLFCTDLRGRFSDSDYAFIVLPFPKYSFSHPLQACGNDIEQLSISPALKMIIEMLDAFHQEVGCHIFSPCGWGAGLSLDSLWQVMEDGFIPLVPKTELTLPGHPKLWSAALFSVNPNHLDADLLLLQLRQLIDGKKQLDQKREAIQQLMFLYGSEVLITDLLHFFVEPHDLHSSSLYFSHQLIYLVEEEVPDEFFLLSLYTRLLVNYDMTYNEVQHDARLCYHVSTQLKKYCFSRVARKIVALTESKGWYLN
ncbi:hypothetical protein [Neptunomonas sp.]|uniref:hypothetical protein n=1 Tax=Neptunomonas sp. TaxID=1971898 RepID=UPI00356A5389